MIFPDVFARYETLCREERPVLVGGTLEVEEGLVKVMVDQMSTLEEALQKARHVVFHLGHLEMHDFEKLNAVLKEHPGPTEVSLQMKLADLGQEVFLEMEEQIKVQIGSELIESLHSNFGTTEFIELRS